MKRSRRSGYARTVGRRAVGPVLRGSAAAPRRSGHHTRDLRAAYPHHGAEAASGITGGCRRAAGRVRRRRRQVRETGSLAARHLLVCLPCSPPASSSSCASVGHYDVFPRAHCTTAAPVGSCCHAPIGSCCHACASVGCTTWMEFLFAAMRVLPAATLQRQGTGGYVEAFVGGHRIRVRLLFGCPSLEFEPPIPPEVIRYVPFGSAHETPSGLAAWLTKFLDWPRMVAPSESPPSVSLAARD